MLRIALALAIVVVSSPSWAGAMCPRNSDATAYLTQAEPAADAAAEATPTALPEPDAAAAETAAAD
ncbi:MAG: hypothetical protein ACREER_12660 [Alphaproteobacteria bacterium]